MPKVITPVATAPKTRKSSPKKAEVVLQPYFKSPNLPKQGEAGFGWAKELHTAGFTEEAVANDLAAKSDKFAAESKAIETTAKTRVPQILSEIERTKTSPVATLIANTVGVEVGRVARGSKTGHQIFGHSHTKFFLWAGHSMWSVVEVQTALKAFGLPEISVLSIRTFLYAGRKGGTGPEACAGRGEAPKYSADQCKQLEAAGGRGVVVEAPKPTPRLEQAKIPTKLAAAKKSRKSK